MRRLVRFGVVSGIGWGLDFLLFAGLVHLAVQPALANAASASAAVVWVYFASVRRIFRYGGAGVRERFLLYAACQAIVIPAASWAIGALVAVAGVPPLSAKIAVTPLTFLINYLVMSRLTRRAPG